MFTKIGYWLDGYVWESEGFPNIKVLPRWLLVLIIILLLYSNVIIH
jgi:hypothetical protein